MTNRELAEKAAEWFFTNAFGDVASRLVLVQDLEGGRRVRNLGGWGRRAFVDQMERFLRQQDIHRFNPTNDGPNGIGTGPKSGPEKSENRVPEREGGG